MGPLPLIYNPKTYRKEIHDFVHQSIVKGNAFSSLQNDIPLFTFGYDQARLAKIIARSIQTGTYQLGLPRKAQVVHKNKSRIVYHYNLSDKIVLKVFLRYLIHCSNLLCPHNYFPTKRGSMRAKLWSNLVNT